MLTKKGALKVTHDLDRLASLFTSEAKTLGLSEKMASGFAMWCDRISDTIERKAGFNPEDRVARAQLLKQALSGEQDHKTHYPFSDSATFDAEQIGEEIGGPLEGDSDESSYMSGEFTQQENRELREIQEAGKLPSVNTDPRNPRPGVQASLNHLAQVIKNGNFSGRDAALVVESLRLATDIATKQAATSTHGYKLNA